jgi:hypothetical protein
MSYASISNFITLLLFILTLAYASFELQHGQVKRLTAVWLVFLVTFPAVTFFLTPFVVLSRISDQRLQAFFQAFFLTGGIVWGLVLLVQTFLVSPGGVVFPMFLEILLLAAIVILVALTILFARLGRNNAEHRV